MDLYNIAQFPGTSAGLHPVAATTTIATGGMVALNAAGNAVPAASSVTGHVIGIATAGVDNSAGNAADLHVEVQRGIYVMQQDATNPVTKAHMGLMVYAITPDTVAYTGTCRAGLLIGFDGTRPIVDTTLGAAVATSGDVSTNAAAITLLQTGMANTTAASAAVANNATPNGNAYITLQAKDYLGASKTGRHILMVWLAATAYAAPADLGTLTATTGTILLVDATDAMVWVVTDANGAAALTMDLAAASGTVHAHAITVGPVATANAAITGG